MWHLRTVRCSLVSVLAAISLLATGTGTTLAQQSAGPTIPNFWDPQERMVKPSLGKLSRLRFLTVTDFPPFSYIDEDKRLSGFHVDLARALCAELEALSVCQIQALPFEEIEQALRGTGGEAAMAGHNVSAALRERLLFTRPYFWLPARFVGRTSSNLQEPLSRALNGKEVAVVADTAHAAYAQAHFGDMLVRQFETLDTALAALEKDQVTAVFGDGLALSFWLQRNEAQASSQKRQMCCNFIGGPYLDQSYFGSGLAIAASQQNPELIDGLNFALRAINDKGIFQELYLRYFPISLY